MTVVLRREMTTDRREFLRVIRQVPDFVTEELAGGALQVRHGAAQVRLELAELPPLPFGPIGLARLAVSFHLPDEQRARVSFLERFDRYFQRGGG